MTSSQFHAVPTADVTILREERQRRSIDDIDSLADSIKRLGLINPITITRDSILIAGERRLTACRALGWTHIPAQYVDEVDPQTLHLIELEENIKRKDLTWQEQHDALMAYFALTREREPDITQEKVGERIGLSKNTMSEHVLVERFKDNPMVAQAESYGTARNVARRLFERAKADELDTHGSRGELYTSPILHGSFLEWAPTYTGPKFNLIHCDFPYGINQQDSGQAGVTRLGSYDDSPEVYWELLKCLAVHLDNFCAPSAHMIFWLSANIEIMARTWEMLKLLDGFKFDEVPLIWVKSDGKGIAPDTQRRFRRTYELAFFGWRNDRKLVRLKDNVALGTTDRDKHPHEKSVDALEHFMSGIVDAQSRVLDPTCGSGSALRAARALGATHVFGIERDEEFARIARHSLAPERTRQDAR